MLRARARASVAEMPSTYPIDQKLNPAASAYWSLQGSLGCVSGIGSGVGILIFDIKPSKSVGQELLSDVHCGELRTRSNDT